MHTKHIGSIITAALLCLLAPFCMAQEARELTSSCVITSPNKKTDSVHDGEYTSFWRSRTGENPYLEFQTPEGEAAQYLYICFAEMPETWSVETETVGMAAPIQAHDGTVHIRRADGASILHHGDRQRDPAGRGQFARFALRRDGDGGEQGAQFSGLPV